MNEKKATPASMAMALRHGADRCIAPKDRNPMLCLTRFLNHCGIKRFSTEDFAKQGLKIFQRFAGIVRVKSRLVIASAKMMA
jgi:hypothetical protein